MHRFVNEPTRSDPNPNNTSQNRPKLETNLKSQTDPKNPVIYVDTKPYIQLLLRTYFLGPTTLRTI